MNRKYKKIIAYVAIAVGVLFSESCNCSGTNEVPPLNLGPRTNSTYSVFKSTSVSSGEIFIGNVAFSKTGDTTGTFLGGGYFSNSGTFIRDRRFKVLSLTNNDANATIPKLDLEINILPNNAVENDNFTGININNRNEQYHFTY